MKLALPYRIADDPDADRLLRLAHAPRATRLVARLVQVALAFVVLGLVFVPWQQNTRGKGRAIAYAPVERQQSVEAPVEGRVVRWHVQEGQHVEAGAPLCEIADNDPLILDRLRQEHEAQEARLAAARARAAAVDGRVVALGGSGEAAVRAAEARVRMAQERVRAAEHAAEAANQGELTARLNLDRQHALEVDGLASKRARELAELEHVKARTESNRADATLRAARTEEAAFAADAMKLARDAQASVQDGTATRAVVDAEIAAAQAEIARLDVRISRQTAQSIVAPRAGTLLRIVSRPGVEMVKTGDLVAVIVPDTTDRAVELWIDGNDVPLVTPGRAVRLQFEGWPAVQFAGWPSVSVGTFGGLVAFVDAAADGSGKFRVVVVPDGREPWPAPRFVRQGTVVNGWVLLDRVRLGYELWRQLNGFPPQLPVDEMFEEKAKVKK